MALRRHVRRTHRARVAVDAVKEAAVKHVRNNPERFGDRDKPKAAKKKRRG